MPKQNCIPDLPDFSTLSAISADTQNCFKDVNQRLIEFEQHLADLNLGVEAWLEDPLLRENQDELDFSAPGLMKQRGEAVQLGFRKSDRGKFRLFCRTVADGSSQHVDVPLLEAPLEIRIQALCRMQHLVSALEMKAFSRLHEIQEKLKKASRR